MDITDSEQNHSDFDCHRDFIRLYQSTERRLYGFVLSLIPNWSEADDIVQETAVVMWSKFKEFEQGTDFTAWALSIARFQVLNHLKKKKSDQKKFSASALHAIEESYISSSDRYDDLRDALQKCLHKLPDKDKELIRMRYELNSKIRVVADRIGRSIDAVYKSLNRVHIQLLNCIRRTIWTQEGL